MKKISLLLVLMINISLSNVMSQKGRMQCANYPNKGQDNGFCMSNLTEDQKEAIKSEKISFMKSVQDEKNKLNELNARKKTLETTEPYDQKAMYTCLEEINKLTVSIRKQKMRHQQAVKKYLTEEQLLGFDMRQEEGRHFYGRRHKSMMKGDRQSHGRRNQMNRHGGKGQMSRADKGGMKKPVFDEAQKEKMKEVHLAFAQKQQPLKNELNELRAAYKTQTSGKDVDLKKVDKLIEQQGAVRLEIAKMKADHHQEIRSHLTDEQKLMWSMRKRHHKKGFGCGRI